MACFIVPAAAAAVSPLLSKRLPARLHAGWLNAILWGGASALVAEHVASGELVFRPPFLTVLSSPASTQIALHEIVSIGVPVTLAMILAWALLVVAYEKTITQRPAGAAAPGRRR